MLILRKISAYALCAITFILIALGYLMYGYELGFPDGHITEYSRAMNIAYKVSIFPLVILGCYFFYLGRMSSEKKITKKLICSVILLIVLIATMLAVDNHFYITRDHGQGG